jgi:hypothetical protein
MEMTLVGNLPFIITEDHCLLIDTGSPISISNVGYIKIEGRHRFLHHRTSMDEEYKVYGLTGGEKDGLLGMDILKSHSLMLDYGSRQALFDPPDPGKPVLTTAIDMQKVIPRIAGDLHGEEHMFIVDTGSGLSFLRGEHTGDRPQWGWENVCHPVYGRFGTPWYRFGLTVSGTNISLRFAQLPAYLEEPLVVAEAAGVIGHEFLSLSKVLLDFKGGKLAFYGGKEDEAESGQ